MTKWKQSWKEENDRDLRLDFMIERIKKQMKELEEKKQKIDV
jgi:hypothetical protein|tara:strand:+ start:577 stop:702 length:126 start_codon:yes stop_codon:yes gene_type:complete